MNADMHAQPAENQLSSLWDELRRLTAERDALLFVVRAAFAFCRSGTASDRDWLIREVDALTAHLKKIT
jgi:hypothetical protein